ncbi:MAG: arginine--tRNA ligase [Pyrinomonadaceae bacterium]|nr:arginine--tRNA ligase [Blastocatellia bacterium]MCW5957451.1 arginine--tRNA ligase [Pyrinomonadaceae bacterium]
MTLTELQSILRGKVREAAQNNFQIVLDQIVAEVPPKTELGDLAFPVAFDLAKQIKLVTGEKQNPRNIAETLKAEIETLEFVDRAEVAGAGYLNVFFDRAKFLAENQTTAPLPSLQRSEDSTAEKVCVEHTSVNPNKAAHIGHVRNSVLGDTFQRILTATGKRVEIQNYIDNTGVQVADVVVGFIYLEHRDLESIKALDKELANDGISFDYYCWDLYAKVGQQYQTDEELRSKRAEVLHLIEKGSNPTAELADHVATRNVECITKTMERLSIRYDLLPRESEILHLHFWNKAFEQMKERGVIHLESEGKNAGCWVMPFEEHTGTDEHEADKILVRSNGTVTYTGKDIAYQMWKLGVLGMDFYYKPFFKYPDGKEIWITTADESESKPHEQEFGHGQVVYNVIDSRQSYPQEVVKKGVAAIHPEIGERGSVHLSYEMVALSPAAAEELGFEVSDEDRKKPFIEMSGRKGLGVKADDLISRLEEKALEEVEKRHPDSPLVEKRHIAHQIAVGALRYFLLKFTRNTVIVFDFKEALSFEGETGLFCQYSAVRANSIFRKLDERGETIDGSAISDAAKVSEIFGSESGTDIWSILILASRLHETVEAAAAQNEPSILAKYTFNLAKAFNLFYHNHKIIAEPDVTKRAVLIAVADSARRSLTAALDTMGIEVPEKM